MKQKLRLFDYQFRRIGLMKAIGLLWIDISISIKVTATVRSLDNSVSLIPSSGIKQPDTPTHQDNPLLALHAKPVMAQTEQIVPSGEHFMDWLRQALESKRIVMNDAKALVHTVDNTAFLVSPGVFQRYAQEHPQLTTLAQQEGLSEWRWIQKRFEQLKQHRKQSSGHNIWACRVSGPRKYHVLHGYLLLSPSCLFEEVPPDNLCLTVQ